MRIQIDTTAKERKTNKQSTKISKDPMQRKLMAMK
jgi:hypothetical protein